MRSSDASGPRHTPGVTLAGVAKVTTDPVEALRRLRSAAHDDTLDRLAERFGLRLLVAFGSATSSETSVDDLDLGYVASRPVDQLGLLAALYELTGYDGVDLVDLDRAGIVLRAEALCGVPLYESQPGLFATAQTDAVVQRMDTRWLRLADLEAMSG